jgi:hypothetical protein
MFPDIRAEEVITTPPYSYQNVNVILSFKHSIIFKVKAGSDAIVGLTTARSEFDVAMYEVVIGGGNNSYTAIR